MLSSRSGSLVDSHLDPVLEKPSGIQQCVHRLPEGLGRRRL